MSYSFSVSAADKAGAKQKVAEAFDNVVKNQPSHSVDRDAAVAAASAMIDILRDPDAGQEVCASVNGYLSWQGVMGGDAPVEFTGANVSASATLRAKPAG